MDSPHALFTRDLGFYLMVVWAAVVVIGCVLAGLEPLWRQWRAAPSRRLDATVPPRPAVRGLPSA